MNIPGLLRDHAVLQQGLPLPLCGQAQPGATVTIAFRGQSWRATADATGRWQATLGPFPAGGPDDLEVRGARGDGTVVRDLLVGEVWLCAGQSNMEFALADAEGGAAAAAAAHTDGIRLLTMPRLAAEEPGAEPADAPWAVCRPEVAARFSAVGYYFGAEIHRRRGVPVGLIQAAVGNTPGEAWLARALLENDDEFRPILERWRRSLAVYPDPDQTYARAFAQWDHDADLAEREGRPIPGAHPKLVGPGHAWTPGGLFNGMIVPLRGYPLRGVIWYQGAGAPDRAYQYRRLFRELIRDWRRLWGQGDFPFLFVQEAGFGPRRAEPGEHSWAELREAQQMALAEPHTARRWPSSSAGRPTSIPAASSPSASAWRWPRAPRCTAKTSPGARRSSRPCASRAPPRASASRIRTAAWPPATANRRGPSRCPPGPRTSRPATAASSGLRRVSRATSWSCGRRRSRRPRPCATLGPRTRMAT